MAFDPISAGLTGGGIFSSALGNIFGSGAADSSFEEAMKILQEMYGKAENQIYDSHKFARKRFQESEALYQPYQVGGLDALKKFQSTLSMPIEGSPLYQWRSFQGNRAIDRTMASRGLYGSSSSINARSELNQALTGEETDKLYGRLQNALQLLGHFGTQGIATGKTQEAQSRWQKGTALSDLYTKLGELLAGLTTQQGQNKAGLYSSLGAMPLQGLGIYSMLNAGGSAGAPSNATQLKIGTGPYYMS